MNRPWRVVIVDDEPLARLGIRSRLETLGGFEVVDECDNGRSALAAIRSQSPDLVFLDIELPNLNGFEVLDELDEDRVPAVIFVTAFDAHAIRAFEAHAFDYILKPIDGARFDEAVVRAGQRLADTQGSDFRRLLLEALHAHGDAAASAPRNVTGDPLNRIIARDGSRITFLEPEEIDWIQADGDYVRIHVGQKNLLIRDTLTRIEASLPRSRFVRIHRSTVVNVGQVREMRIQPNKTFLVVLRNGTTLKTSRTYAEPLRAALGLR